MDLVSVSNEPYQLAHINQSLQPNVLASTIVLLVIAILSVVFRCLARYRSRAKLGVDDLLIGIALLPIIGSATGMLLGLRYGLGRHYVLIKDNYGDRKGFFITYTLDVVWFALATALTKGSVLCFYCRIFKSKTLYRISWGLGIFIFMYNLATVLVICLECVPLETLWTKPDEDRSYYCYNTKPGIVTLGIINILTDFVILSIPVRYVVRLNMSSFRKLQVCGAFLTGTIVCVFGVVRVVAFAIAKDGDATYNETFAVIWTFCEMCIGILAACLPTMGLLVTEIHQSVSEIRHSTVVMSLHDALSESIKSRLRSMSSPLRSTFYSDRTTTTRSGRETQVLSIPEPPEMAQVQGLLGVDIPSHRLYQHSTDIGGFVPSQRSSQMIEEPATPSGFLSHIRIPSYQLHRLSGHSGLSIPLPWTKNYDWRWERLQEPTQDV